MSTNQSTEVEEVKKYRLDTILPPGVPLEQYELAFGWRGYECPVHFDKKGNYHCRECKTMISDKRYEDGDLKGELMDPSLPARFAHQESCPAYKKWRLARWTKFNRSIVGSCVGLFFRQNLIPYFNINCEQQMANNLDSLFHARISDEPSTELVQSSSSSSSSSSKVESE